MGKYEDQLKALGAADAEWSIDGFEELESQMERLRADMAAIAAEPGWTGKSAEAASTLFETLNAKFQEKYKTLGVVKEALKQANEERAKAAAKQSSLPDAEVPFWLHGAALLGGSVMVPGIGTFAAETVVQKVNDYMGLQREAAAQQELETLEANLAGPKATLNLNRLTDDFEEWPEPVPSPDWPGEGVVYPGDDTGAGGWRTKGAPTYSGGGGGTGSEWEVIRDPGPDDRDPEVVVYPPNPPIVLPPVRPPGWPEDFVVKPPEISIDGDSGDGSNPGGFLGGGGLGSGLAGAGAGAAGLGAAKLASKGGLGGGGLFGPNGLLGGGAGSAGGAGGAGTKGGVVATAGGAGGTGAGARGGNAMMGGGGQGGGDEKNKRNSLGLLAPKLEDDEESGPRSSAAGAGGRE